MKKQLLIPCLILLAASFLPAKANENHDGDYPKYSSSSEHPMPQEGWSPENTSYTSEGDFNNFNHEEFDEEDFDMPESSNFDRIYEIIKEIENVYSALVAELEEYHNRNLKKVVDKLDKCVDIFNEVMSENEEDVPTNCEDGIKWGLKIFQRAISLLEQRKCNEVTITRRCIPQEIADKYIPQLKELYARLEKELLTDEDEDGSPDVCKYFEEWEDDEHPPISEEHHNNNL